jgi:hypothetical protein
MRRKLCATEDIKGGSGGGGGGVMTNSAAAWNKRLSSPKVQRSSAASSLRPAPVPCRIAHGKTRTAHWGKCDHDDASVQKKRTQIVLT